MAQLIENPERISIASGLTERFPTVWTFESASEVEVSIDAGAGFVVQMQGVAYDLTGGDWLNDGADVVFKPGFAPPAGSRVLRRRVTAKQQKEPFGDTERFRPEASEAAYDRLTRQTQELAAQVGRAVVVAPGETPPTAADIAALAGGLEGVFEGAREAGAEAGAAAAGDKANRELDNASRKRAADAATLVAFQRWADDLPYTPAEFGVPEMATATAAVDATAKLQKMIDDAASSQRTVKVAGKYYVNGTLFMRKGVVLEGSNQGTRVKEYAEDRVFDNYGLIVLGPNGRIVSDFAFAWTLRRVHVVSSTVVGARHVSTAEILAEVESWWTKRVTALSVCWSSDVTIEDCMFVGFKRAIMFYGCERMLVRNVRVDCHAGVEIRQLYDVGRVENLHTWAFYTYGQNNDPATSPRKGASLRLSTRVDGIISSNHLSFGYQRGIDLDGNNWFEIRIVNPGSGYTSPPTVTLSGGSGSGATAYATLTPNGSVGHVIVDDPGQNWTTAPPTVTITGGGGSGATASAIIYEGEIYASKFTGIWLDHAFGRQQELQAIAFSTRGICREIVVDGHIDAHFVNAFYAHASNTAGGVTDIGLTMGISAQYQRRFFSGDGTSIGCEVGGEGPGALAVNRVDATAGRWLFDAQKATATGNLTLWDVDPAFDRTKFIFNGYHESANGKQWDYVAWATTLIVDVHPDQVVPAYDGVTERRVGFGRVAVDPLNEFNASIVTPKIRGFYTVDFIFSFLPTANGYLEFLFFVDGVPWRRRVWRQQVQNGLAVADIVSTGITLNPLQTFEVRVRAQGGGSLIGDGFTTLQMYRHPRGRS